MRVLIGCLGLMLGLMLALCAPALAQQQVSVPSLDGTVLTGYFYAPATKGPNPAVVFLHGCGGMLNKMDVPDKRATAWAALLNAQGYAVLALDSFTARNIHNMCAAANFDASIYATRAKDAVGGLAWLQARPDIAPGRIALIGWSQGGGVVLHTIDTASASRPSALPHGDFRAAIAFYPGSCSLRQMGSWRTAIPLQVLVGASDVWTPAAPCQTVIEDAAAAGSPAAIKLYPGAYHDFDWPDMKLHEAPAYRRSNGVVPIQGMNPDAMADAYRVVPAFLAERLKP